jgi:hypothetical protein
MVSNDNTLFPLFAAAFSTAHVMSSLLCLLSQPLLFAGSSGSSALRITRLQAIDCCDADGGELGFCCEDGKGIALPPLFPQKSK